MLGIIYACIPLFGWGIGDFLIQKSVRKVGVHQTLGVTGLLGGLMFLPWVWRDIGTYSLSEYGVLSLIGCITFCGALLLFEALRVGKISIVEAIVSIELPLSVFLSVFVGGEVLPISHWILFAIVSIGIMLAVTDQFENFGNAKHILEKGTLLALSAACFSALTNFSIGFSSQAISPIFVVWYTHLFLGVVCLAYVLTTGTFRETVRIVRAHKGILFTQGALDNIAWAGYALAASVTTVSLTVTISESYVVIAALLGYLVGKEQLRSHQIIGSVVAFAGVIVLTFLHGGLEG